MAVHIIAVGSHHSIVSIKSWVTPEAAKASPVDPDPLRPRVEFVGNLVVNNLEQHRALAEQQTCLQNAASVAHLPFDPTAIKNCGYLAKLKLGLAYKSSPDSDDDFQGESSELSYGLSLALLCAKHSGMYDYEGVSNIPVFATGRLPQGDGSVLSIDNLQAKLKAVCDYMKSDNHERAFYFFYPKGNALSPALDGTSDADAVEASWKALLQRANRLNGKVIAVSTLKEAVAELLGEHLITTIDSDETFPGIKPILWLDRHLYRGRESVIQQLEHKARLSYQSNNILVVEGPSGSGKSSVVLGGMAARLVHPKETSSTDAADNQLSHTRFREPHRITPASYDNLTELLKGLLSNITDDEAVLTQWLDSDTSAALTQQIKAYLNTQAEPDKRPWLWVIDQAEELFTHSPYPQGIANTLCEYLTALAAELDVLIISIHRIEYQSMIPWRKNNPDHLATVDTPAPSEMVDLIERQITARNLELELTTDAQPKTLRQRIVDDIDRMPLTTVGTLLQQMNELKKQQDPSGEVLRHTYYDAVGQAQGAMAHLATAALRHADNNYRQQNPHADDEQIHTLHHCLFELFVGVDEDGSPITLAPSKQQVNDYTIANDLWRYIDIFRDHGLIVEYGWGNIPRYKFAHDTLISGISQYDDSENHSQKSPVTQKNSNTQHTWAVLGQWWANKAEYLGWRRSIQNLLEFWVDYRVSGEPSGSEKIANKESSITHLNDTQLHIATGYQVENLIHIQELQKYIESSRQIQLEEAQEAQRQLERIEGLTKQTKQTLSLLNEELWDIINYVPSAKRSIFQTLTQELTVSLEQYGFNDVEEKRLRAKALLHRADEILNTDLYDTQQAFPIFREAHDSFLANSEVAPENLRNQRDLSVSLERLANLCLRNGKTDQALAGYREVISIGRILINKAPNNLEYQYDLSVSHDNISNLFLRNGNIGPAQAGYQAAMYIRQELVIKAPYNLEFQRGLSVSHDKLADLSQRRGKIDQASRGYRAALAIRQALIDKDPNNLHFQRSLSVSHNKLANLHLRNGDTDQALVGFRAAMAIDQALVEKDPNNLQFQRELSVSHDDLADLHLRNDDTDQALAGYQAAMEIRQRLVNHDLNNLDFQRDLSVSYSNLADLDLHNGDTDQALAGYQAAMEIRQRLVNKDNKNLEFQQDLAESHRALACMHLRIGDIDQALKGYQEAIKIDQALVKKDPENLDFLLNLSLSHSKLADLQLRNGNLDQALAGHEAVMGFDSNKLLNEHRNTPEYQREMIGRLYKLGIVCKADDKSQQAIHYWTEALAKTKKLLEKEPTSSEYRNTHAYLTRHLAELKLDLVNETGGKPRQARHYWKKALEKTNNLLEKDPANSNYRSIHKLLSGALAGLYE